MTQTPLSFCIVIITIPTGIITIPNSIPNGLVSMPMNAGSDGCILLGSSISSCSSSLMLQRLFVLGRVEHATVDVKKNAQQGLIRAAQRTPIGREQQGQ